MLISHPYIERLCSDKLKKLFEHFPCVVLLGARQVGKSTLLSHIFQKATTVVFDPIQDIQHARSDPDLFLANQSLPVILDEVQHVPELLPALKRFIDKNNRPGQFLLTGPQQWGVLNCVTESLAGCAIIQQLNGFSLSEVAHTVVDKSWLEYWLDDPESLLSRPLSRLSLPFSLYEHLWRGTLPEVQFYRHVPMQLLY